MKKVELMIPLAIFCILAMQSVLATDCLNIRYSSYENNLNFPIFPYGYDYIGYTMYAKNNIRVQWMCKRYVDVYACGDNFPGAVEFRKKQGTIMSGFVILPECDNALPFNNGIKINIFPMWYYSSAYIYSPRITYTESWKQGTVRFYIEEL